MSGIWNPFAFGVTGQPVAPQTNALRVYGAEPSKEQLAMAQHAFAQFCSTSRLSAVPNPMEQGWLPDGSKYRTVTVGNMRVMEVWTEAEATAASASVFGGLLRMHGSVSGAGGGAYYREFKENAGPKNNPPRYVDTNKFNDPLTGEVLVGGGLWGAFSATDLSGPAAKLAQFGRGALSAYTAYFRRKNIPLNYSRRIGHGVFILTDGGGNKRAFCYTHPKYDNISRAVPMPIVSYAEFGTAKIPAEIKELFGGVPIPPLDYEFENVAHNKIISRADVRAAVGAGVGETTAYAGEMGFPVYATTGDGLDVYFIAGKHGPLPGSTDPRAQVSRSALMRMQISSEGEGGVPKAVLTRETALEISRFSGASQRDLPVGVYRSYAGVTHYSGVLTTFMRTMHIVNWHYTPSRVEPVLAKEELEWSGGIAGHIVTAHAGSVTVSGGYSGRHTLTHVGEEVETTEGGGGITEYTYEILNSAASISASPRVTRDAEPNRGSLTTVGLEGTFIVSRSSMGSYVSAGFSGSGQMNRTYRNAVIKIRSYYGGKWTTTYEAEPTDVSLYNRDYSATLVRPHEWGYVAFTGPGTEPGFWSGQYTYYPRTVFGGEWRLDPPGWEGDHGAVNLAVPEKRNYDGSTLYANGAQIAFDMLDVLADVESPSRHAEIVSHALYVSQDPIKLVSRPQVIDGGGSPVYVCATSTLGGKQALLMVNARNPVGELIPKSFTHGTLVNNAEDKTYPSSVKPLFVGELQP